MRERVACAGASVTRGPIHIPRHVPHPASAEHPPDRGRLEAVQTLAHLPVQIPAVVVIDQLGVVDEDDDSRGPGRDLATVIYLRLRPVPPRRGRLPEYRVPQHLVQHRRRYPPPVRPDGRVHRVVDLPAPLPRRGRDEEDRRPPDLGQLLAEVLDRLVVRARVLVEHGVPLVAYDDARAAVVRDLLGQDAVLLGHAGGGVEDEQDDVCAAYGAEGAVHHEELRPELHLALAPDPGRVDKAVNRR
mmetsp:Transcript_12961/g.30637  ORF Transcript_12961/g.30637 Transcript_12961/m.30637 type:complete len:244 (+) Transcript_12961:72-803(+)